jgi:UDP-N-acetylglucosamine acyltransferase
MNYIHPGTQGNNYFIGDGNYIGPHCTIYPGTRIGNNNRFEGYCTIGSPPEHASYWPKENLGIPMESRTKIGDDNVIREFTTINGGTVGFTEMGNKCIMLRGSHLSHDSILEDSVVVSCNVLIGGESYIMRGANLALGSIIHQKQIIGSYAMIAMGAIVTKKLQCVPGNIYAGNPATFLKENEVGLHRNRIEKVQLWEEIDRFKHMQMLRGR